MTVNTYVLNFTEQALLVYILQDMTILLSDDRLSRLKKIQQENFEINYTTDQIDLITSTEYLIQELQNICCSWLLRYFSPKHCILGHKTSINEYKNIEIASSIFPNPITEIYRD